MPFAEDLPVRNFDQTLRRPTTDYVRFTDQYRVVLRVLNEEARTVWRHYITQANKGKGMSANCPNVRADMSVCPLELSVRGLPKESQERKDKIARRRYITNVLDRTPHTICPACNTNSPQTRSKDCISCGSDLSKADFQPLNKVKIMEGGIRLFNQGLNVIADNQAQDFDGADITEYDIVFTTTGENREKQIAPNPRQPTPLPAEALLDPLTGEKQALYDLDLLAEPSSLEEINLMLQGASKEDIFAARENSRELEEVAN